MKQSREMSKWHQLEKCLLDCEEGTSLPKIEHQVIFHLLLVVIHMARCSPKYADTEYEGLSLAYQCGLVKGDDRIIQQYRRSLLQRGTSRADMLQLERAALEGVGTKSCEPTLFLSHHTY